MKTTGFRSSVLYLLLFGFIGGMAYLVISVLFSGESYINQPYNGHIFAADTTVVTGNIVDRNGVVLAESENGIRVYNENESIRKSLLHTVGDSSGFIGTSVQSSLRSDLIGYNFITGLNNIPSFTGDSSNDIKLTIDSSLNATAYNALAGKNGAILVSNYETGEILAKVSAPGYDPMNIPSDLLENEMYEGVFLDNTISSSYTPGSVFKLVTAASAIENIENAENLVFNCQQTLNVDGSVVTCLGYHGDIDMTQALGVSCNIYFAHLAQMLSADTLQQTAEEMGFNKAFSLPDFTTAESSINLIGASDLELSWASVGQHTVTMNPMNMLMIVHAIANDGEAVSPRITEQGLFDAIGGNTTKLLDKETANSLEEMMRVTVRDYYGDYLFPNLEFCAKTGTAEVGGQNPNSWFVGFSSNPDKPYAVVIVVEEGGSGIGTAGNIASALMSML